MSRRLHLAVFTSEDKLFSAVRACRESGIEILDVRSPYPLHGIDELAGIPPSRLPGICLTGGVVGLGVALWFQYWSSSVDWPIDVGGKPWNSLPAFAPVAFEVTVLLAGLATVFAFLGGLFPARRRTPAIPADAVPAVTDDRFTLVVTRPDASVTDAGLGALWRRTGAERSLDFVEDAR